MMKRMAFVIALLVAVLALPAFAQEASRQDFDEYVKAILGRWVGEITWATEVPGVAEKGQITTTYVENTVTEDGNGVVGRGYGGTGSATWLTVYDAGSKRIKTLIVFSGGTVNERIVYRNDGKWITHSVGSDPDGTKAEATSTLSISDDGKTHTFIGAGTRGGTKFSFQDVWRRVSK